MGFRGFLKWWFRPGVTLLVRLPIVIGYPILGLAGMVPFFNMIGWARPHEPEKVVQTIWLGFPILLLILIVPAAAFFGSLAMLYRLWNKPADESRAARVAKSAYWLVFPFVLYLVFGGCLFLVFVGVG